MDCRGHQHPTSWPWIRRHCWPLPHHHRAHLTCLPWSGGPTALMPTSMCPPDASTRDTGAQGVMKMGPSSPAGPCSAVHPSPQRASLVGNVTPHHTQKSHKPWLTSWSPSSRPIGRRGSTANHFSGPSSTRKKEGKSLGGPTSTSKNTHQLGSWTVGRGPRSLFLKNIPLGTSP